VIKMSFADWTCTPCEDGGGCELKDPDDFFTSKYVRIWSTSTSVPTTFYRTIPITNTNADVYILQYDYRLRGRTDGKGFAKVYIDDTLVYSYGYIYEETEKELKINVTNLVKGKSSITLKFEVALGVISGDIRSLDIDNIKLLTGEEL